MPQPIGDDETELISKRKKWMESIHRAAPGVDWEAIEAVNHDKNRSIKNMLISKGRIVQQEAFAGGKLQGTWSEKGSLNQAGSIQGVDYDSSSNNLYVVSDGGSLWRNNGLVVNNWTLLNDDYQFTSKMLKVIKLPNGNRRILVGINKRIYYSDNEGQTFTASNISFPISWGGNEVIQLEVGKGSSSNEIAILVYGWEETPWAPRISTHRSTDNGASFTRMSFFNHGEINMMRMMVPYNDNIIYIFDGKSVAGNWVIWKVGSGGVTGVASVAQPEAPASMVFRGVKLGGTTTLYVLNGNKKLYRTTDLGATWNLQGVLPSNSWERLDVSNSDATQVFYGEVDAFRSINSGVSWTRVNGWAEYYGNVASKLHADIMEIRHFRQKNGTPFVIINNHGGTYVSYDGMVTTQNLSVQNLMSAQYYDILTPPDNNNIIYAGSQDQGFQKTSTALTSGPQLFNQVISGDYGYLTLSSSAKNLYTQYPGGALYMYTHPELSYIGSYTMPGTTKPNYGWMLPMENMPSVYGDTVLMAGGNINGGSGSYLCKVVLPVSPPYTLKIAQINFDFRGNSSNGSSGITAIEVSSLQPNKWYVALENGNFFYSNNAGQSWNLTSSFGPITPWFLYGSTIVASKLTPNLVWFGGTGYSNAPVYRSADGGVTFTPMNNGLPFTVVHEMVTNVSETMIFAATDAGPYVYIVADNQWYPMQGALNPVQMYTSVEFLPNLNTVRFGTYGRGIWDFTISSPSLYAFKGTGDWNTVSNWGTSGIPPANLPTGTDIYINPASGTCNLKGKLELPAGVRCIVAPGKSLLINGTPLN